MKKKPDFDLFVLRLPDAMGICRKAYLNIAKRLALTAFLSGDGHGETAAQFERIGAYLWRSELCSQFAAKLSSAVKGMPKSQAALIKKVFVECVSPVEIAERCGVSLSTVYRKLRAARKSFANALTREGLTKQWLSDNFGDLPLLAKVKQVNGVKTVTFVPDLALVGLQSALM